MDIFHPPLLLDCLCGRQECQEDKDSLHAFFCYPQTVELSSLLSESEWACIRVGECVCRKCTQWD